MISCGIIGATGYTGGELIRLLDRHPQASLQHLGTRSHQGVCVGGVHDGLYHREDLVFVDSDIDLYKELDVVFLALPHGFSSRAAKTLVSHGVKVIDLGADFRLNDYAEYAEWYAADHHWPDAMRDVPYGLPEVYKKDIAEASLVANPGCFPTAIILALGPLLKEGLVNTDFLVADAYSGVTGAGKTPTESTHFSQINENIWAYNVGKHRHTAEILQTLESIGGSRPGLVFTPHLAPFDRGILATITGVLTSPLSDADLNTIYQDTYRNAPFIRIRKPDQGPNVKAVRGSNYCDICPHLLPGQKVVLVSAIDNLVKGAAGQAVQNMNIMFGYDETLGLETHVLKP